MTPPSPSCVRPCTEKKQFSTREKPADVAYVNISNDTHKTGYTKCRNIFGGLDSTGRTYSSLPHPVTGLEKVTSYRKNENEKGEEVKTTETGEGSWAGNGRKTEKRRCIYSSRLIPLTAAGTFRPLFVNNQTQEQSSYRCKTSRLWEPRCRQTLSHGRRSPVCDQTPRQ